MQQRAQEITPITIEKELKQSYLDYAMSVIVGRALPDVRDGLKPVHRRVLFAMHELHNDWNKPHKKSARIVGDVMGKYHPHGDSAIYDTIVRMAQPFSLRYLLVDGQGNFGSVDGDAPAAMRYTEVRMSKLAHSLLADLDKDTVDFEPNYDATENIPEVLPTRIPNLLINGSSGIAVGMATNIPPHNLNEVIEATIALIQAPDLTLSELLHYVPGPDFPTGGMINGRAGIINAYQTGQGKIYVRAKANIETSKDHSKIIVNELPYQVNKARLLEKIAELIRDKRITGIAALQDESDKKGMRVVIELQKGQEAEVILNNLFNLTAMQSTFSINNVALDEGHPKLFSLKAMLETFIKHRRDVITRRSLYELKKARERIHILEGLAVALANIDTMITLIKQASTPTYAKQAILDKIWPANDVQSLLARADTKLTKPSHVDLQYGLTDAGYRLFESQAQAILDLKLHRLTGLEQDKIHKEYDNLIEQIQELISILSDPDHLNALICEELNEAKSQFGDVRRTVIMDDYEDFSDEDLIPQENCVVTLSHLGYIKSQSLDSYSAQRRGGRGKTATTVKEEDFVKEVIVANTHTTLLCFSSIGKVYWIKGYQIPKAQRAARGRPIVNLLALAPEEYITTILPVRYFDQEHFIFLATCFGKVKRVRLSEFSKPINRGKIATTLEHGDYLIAAAITDGQQTIMLVTNAGKAIRFNEDNVRAMGRTAAGVRGIRMKAGQKVISLIIPNESNTLLTATINGFGQRTYVKDYPMIARAGQGVIAIRTGKRNGEVVSAVQVANDDEILLITDRGTMVRTLVNQISVFGRHTQGVRLIRLNADEKLVSVEAVNTVQKDDQDLNNEGANDGKSI